MDDPSGDLKLIILPSDCWIRCIDVNVGWYQTGLKDTTDFDKRSEEGSDLEVANFEVNERDNESGVNISPDIPFDASYEEWFVPLKGSSHPIRFGWISSRSAGRMKFHKIDLIGTSFCLCKCSAHSLLLC
jgi:hypothetical protein